jgi:uncharacterized protein YjdB
VQTHRSGSLPIVCTCEGKTATASVIVGAGAVQSVFISPPPPVIEAGVPFTLEAWVVSETGAVIDSSEVSWHSSDPEIATVAAGGRVGPRGEGDVTITASAGGVDAAVNFSVAPSSTGWTPSDTADEAMADPADILTTSAIFSSPTPDLSRPGPDLTANALPEPTPTGESSIVTADDASFTSTPKKKTSKLLLIGLPLVIAGVAVGAVLANRDGPSVEQTGAGTYVDTRPVPGTVGLSGVPDTATVGDTFTVAATVVDTTRSAVAAAAAGWRSSNPEIAAVDSLTGRVTAVAAGEVTIDAQVDGKPASARLVVAPRPPGSIARIDVAPARLRLIEGRKQQLTANLVDSANAPVIGQVTWQVEDTTIATIDPTGNISTRKPGRTNVVASSGAVTAKVPLTVAAKEGETDAEAIRGQVETFLTALNGRNAQRITALYTAESPQDKENLSFLLETTKQAGSNLRASALSVSAPEIGWTEATANFTIRLSWKPAAGAAKSQTVPFRATLEKGGTATSSWKLLGVRATEKIQ